MRRYLEVREEEFGVEGDEWGKSGDLLSSCKEI